MSQPLSDQMVPVARSPESVETSAGEFGAFYQRWHAQLLSYVSSTCGARDADEITQETMARALVAMDLSRDPDCQWRWLRVVARNVAADMGRSRKLCDVASDAPYDVERVAAINVEQQLLDSECLQELHHVLTALSPKQSRAWWLTIAEGMPPTAIAATLGCSPESVRQALFKTRHKLAAAMARFCERAEGVGAIGVLAIIGRRFRGLSRPVKHASAPAPLALAAAGVVGTLALLTVPAHLGGSGHVPATQHPTWNAAAESTKAHANPSQAYHAATNASGGHISTTKTQLGTRINQPGASAFVSRHPLGPGTQITVRVVATTPVGDATAETTLSRSQGIGVICDRNPVVSCN